MRGGVKEKRGDWRTCVPQGCRQGYGECDNFRPFVIETCPRLSPGAGPPCHCGDHKRVNRQSQRTINPQLTGSTSSLTPKPP